MNDKIESLQQHDERLDRSVEKHRNWLMQHDIDVSGCKKRIAWTEEKIKGALGEIETLHAVKADKAAFEAVKKKLLLEDIRLDLKIMKQTGHAETLEAARLCYGHNHS